MSWEQISSILRHILTFGGGFVVAKGWVSETVMMQIIGAIISIGGVVWGAFNRTSNSIINQAAALPVVQSIKLEPSATMATMDATPANVTK